MQPSEGLDLHQATVYYQHPQPGFLLIQGEDRVAFLQRQTTNDLLQVTAGTTQANVLTSPTGRILDVFNIFAETEREGIPGLSVVTLPGRAGQTQAYLQRRIFFKDQVQIVNVSDDYDQMDLEGFAVERVLQALGMGFPQEGRVWQGEVEGTFIRVLSRPGFIGNTVRLVIPKSKTGAFSSQLQNAGVICVSEPGYEILRVEYGCPGPGSELTEAYTPLEMHLYSAISTQKGCYTGQEVIARQITYDKITRHLVGLTLDNPVKSGEQVVSGNLPAGTVTSQVVSPRFGPIALAVVKRPFATPGTVLAVESAFPVEARICSLPFDLNR